MLRRKGTPHYRSGVVAAGLSVRMTMDLEWSLAVGRGIWVEGLLVQLDADMVVKPTIPVGLVPIHKPIEEHDASHYSSLFHVVYHI